ncbi:MAG: DUF655 domain-containing protein [archaeon]
MKKEENAIALEYLKKGYKKNYKRKPVVQAIGTNHFTLLELIPKEDAKISLGEKLYIGKDDREKIEYIKSTLEYKDLTTTAKNELEKVVETLVEENEDKFVKFFNKTGPITIKEHSLELLPGIGKKHMEKILDERRKKEFKSYEEIEERVDLMPNPKKPLSQRLLEELEGNTKYNLFTKKPKEKRRR